MRGLKKPFIVNRQRLPMTKPIRTESPETMVKRLLRVAELLASVQSASEQLPIDQGEKNPTQKHKPSD